MRITLKRHALLYSAAGALFMAGTLQAGLVSTVNSSGQFGDLFQSFGCSNAGTTTASCDVSAGVDAFHDASGSYQANAQYGSLDVTSKSSVYDFGIGYEGYLAGTSSASFSDTFLLTGGVGSGTLVFVTEYGGYGQGESCDTGACQFNSTVALNTFSFHPNGNFYLPINLSFSFTFGTPFNLSASASAYSSAEGDELATQTAHLKIDSIEVLDSNGALITDYAVTSGSGAAYPFVTPEPGTFALVIAALIALPIIRRKSISACRTN
jgi:hypothetical protein